MLSVIPRPPHFSLATPYITVRNIDTAVDFYEKAFGFRLKEKTAGEDGHIWHAEMFYHDQLFMFGREGAYGNYPKAPSYASDGAFSPMNLYLYCEDIEKYYRRAVNAGARVLSEPANAVWGDRLCQLQCPEGYIWTFAFYSGGSCQHKT